MREAEKQTIGEVRKLNVLSEVEGKNFAPVASSSSLAWNGFRLERHQVFKNVQTPEICFPAHIIGFLIEGNYKKDIFDNQTSRRTISHRGENALLYPRGLPHVGHSFSKADFLVLYIEPTFLNRAAGEISVREAIEIVPQPQFADALVTDVIKHLLVEVETDGATGSLFAESLATALAARIVKNYSTAKLLPQNYKGGLARAKLRLVLEYINAHLTENLSLKTLASICGLSPYHFAKQFKQSTGFAPHAFVLRERIERAKQLLQLQNMNVAQIALETGFCDQSHFARHFRKIVGVSPCEFSRQH